MENEVMVELDGINYLAIAAVWILYMAVGAWWYSPAGFAKQWAKHTGVDIMKFPTNKANQIIGFVSLSALIQSVALAVILNSLDITTVTEGLLATFVIWLGFTSATTVGVTLYSKRSWKFLWLNSSYFLITMSIGSVILSVWQ